MGYEIDFLSTSSDTKSGDAIAVRFGNLYGQRNEQTVVVIDGGFTDDGERLVDLIRTHYHTEYVDLVISTHPDQDHINGLLVVLDQMQVGELWMHLPWEHNRGLADKFVDGRITDNSISDRLKAGLNKAHALYELAIEKGVTVREPFAGRTDRTGCVKVLGPSRNYYESLIPYFDFLPAAKQVAETQGLLRRAMDAAKRWFAQWGLDLNLSDDGETSAKNNSSVITQIIVDGQRLLFTGDAGIDALSHAADQVDVCTNPAELKFIQIPHHGSRRNVGPTVLNRLIGAPIGQGQSRSIVAIASAAKSCTNNHPRKSVLNAFIHRGAKVAVTRGASLILRYDAPERGWDTVDIESYHWQYEE